MENKVFCCGSNRHRLGDFIFYSRGKFRLGGKHEEAREGVCVYDRNVINTRDHRDRIPRGCCGNLECAEDCVNRCGRSYICCDGEHGDYSQLVKANLIGGSSYSCDP